MFIGLKQRNMKNYIDSEQHWEDSVNADHDYLEAMEKEQEDNIYQQQESPIYNLKNK
ncbi:hypothetical protein Phi13:2_gp110 [Cellulophaga phage phi13:2]|uniref:Uncharacterized protein n=1 Tax=Cellulophaga phage phi13:2 TaxID=1328030 RepID=S0A4L0_9CAUD|nr:hypothetical protein Phi13:2_gp110 [Cellulophaga phage phi13:2]AGO49720.1 hypothetical protein Phi13:2_gp110 [Cellulophaga phage phi13:2]